MFSPITMSMKMAHDINQQAIIMKKEETRKQISIQYKSFRAAQQWLWLPQKVANSLCIKCSIIDDHKSKLCHKYDSEIDVIPNMSPNPNNSNSLRLAAQ